MKGKDYNKCMSGNIQTFQTASEYAIWGRELLNKIAWVIFGTSCGVMLLFVIFVIAMNQDVYNQTKFKWCKFYIFSGFILILVAIIIVLFYYFNIARKLSEANEGL